MEFTFIMPAYNAEKTIDRAVRSIMAQTYADIQILIIDDGSTDSTLKKIEQLASEDNRIDFIHKENGGIGSAYITAFENVKGEYLLFVDSDDYIESNLAEVVKRAIDDTFADIVQFGRKRLDDKGNVLRTLTFTPKILKGSETIIKDYLYGISQDTNFPGLSIRAIRASLLNDFDYYSSSLSIDEVLALHVSSRAKSLVYLSGTYYCAVTYNTSVSRAKVNVEKVKGQFDGLSLLPKIVSGKDSEIQALISIRLLSFISNFYIYFVEAYRKPSASRIINDLYSTYNLNKNNATVLLKTKITLFCVRYFPSLILLKNLIRR